MEYLEGIQCSSTAVCCTWLRLHLAPKAIPPASCPSVLEKDQGIEDAVGGRGEGAVPTWRTSSGVCGCAGARGHCCPAPGGPSRRGNLQNWLTLAAFITKPQSRRKNLSESLMNHKALGFLRQLQFAADVLRYYCPVFYRNA